MPRKNTAQHSFLITCLLSLFILHPVWADDTEIFFGSSTGDYTVKPNVLLVIDASASMQRYDCGDGSSQFKPCDEDIPTENGTKSRLTRMISALEEVLTNTADLNMGLMRFGGYDGGRMLYPVSYLDGPGDVRTEMIELLDDIETVHGTPTVGALEEAWRYFKGLDVVHGKSRAVTVFSSDLRRSRVSHPDSYTGGSMTGRGQGCSDANLNHVSCANEKIIGDAVYDSPVESECQANHVIILTDGGPYVGPHYARLPAYQKTIDTVEEEINGSCTDPSGLHGKCGVELSRYMHEEHEITTHLIGFNVDNDWIYRVAEAGGPPTLDADGNSLPNVQSRSHTAESSDDLVRVISSIVSQVSETDSTFVAPSATIDQFSRLSHRKELYLALFTPQSTTSWKGNLKRYNLTGSIATLKDADDNVAVDGTTGAFIPESRSFWSEAADGGDIALGGAAENLDPFSRNILSYLDTNVADLLSVDNRITPGNDLVTAAMLGASDAERETFISWLTGFDVNDEDGDGSVDDARKHIGDPLHSSPVVVTYGFEADQAVDENNLNSLVFFGTNEGFLHAIDSNDGTEEYAFMPRELMPNVAELFRNRGLSGVTPKLYGLDGDLTLRTIDHDNDGLIETDGENVDEAYLYMGMRRGGRNYYALDVSKKSQPKFLWNIIGGEGDFAELGQSWSKPESARIKVGSEIRDVLVFGGGYDPQQDDYETRTADTVGRAIYIVDADTGNLIWSGGNPATQPTTGNYHQSLPDMRYSIPSDLALVSDTQTGLLSQIYVGDMGGQLWRFDIDNGSSVVDLVDGGVIAEFADDSATGTRRFYSKPDLSLSRVDSELVINIGIGSGYRAHPLDESTEDMFFVYRYPFNGHGDSNYGVRDGTTYEAATIDDLFDTTNNVIVEGDADQINTAEQQLAMKEGWRITLEDSGEKILSHASTINGVVRFVSYVPARASDICEPDIGSSYFYAVNLNNGAPFFDDEDGEDGENGTSHGMHNRKSKLPGGGIAPPISTIFVEHEGTVTPTDVSGLNTVHEWDNIDMIQRWFWAETPE